MEFPVDRLNISSFDGDPFVGYFYPSENADPMPVLRKWIPTNLLDPTEIALPDGAIGFRCRIGFLDATISVCGCELAVVANDDSSAAAAAISPLYVPGGTIIAFQDISRDAPNFASLEKRWQSQLWPYTFFQARDGRYYVYDEAVAVS